MSGFPIPAPGTPAATALAPGGPPPPSSPAASGGVAAGAAAAPRRRSVVPLLALSGAGMSLVLLVQTLWMRPFPRDAFLLHNLITSVESRRTLLATVLLGGALPLLGSVAALLLAGARAAAWVTFLGELLGPLIPLAMLPALFSVSFSHANQLVYGLVLTAFVLIFEPLLRVSLRQLGTLAAPAPALLSAEPWRGRASALARSLPRSFPRLTGLAIVVAASAAYAAYVSFFTIRNHHRLGTTAFDLGIYDNLMYNALHGHPFVSPVLFGPAGGNYLAGHAEFGMLLFVPFYALRPGPETMLVIQAVVLGFAAVPLYLFAATRLPRSTSVVIAVAYLLYAPLHGPNFYDFHWIPLAIFFHFWLYYAISTRRTWLAVAMVLVLYSIREDVAVGLALLGLFLVFTGLRLRFGLILTIASVLWFAIVRFVIMPLAGAWYFQNLYNGLFAEGVSTFGSVIKTILTNPVYAFGTLLTEQKLVYVLHMLAPLAFLPCRRAPLFLLAISGIFFTILTTGYGPTIQISFQYTTHWIPYLFLATVLGVMMLSAQPGGQIAGRAAVATLAVAMLAHSYNFGAILQQSSFVGGFSHIEFRMSAADEVRYRELKELVAMIPPQASVAATEQETAHVSTRRVVYPLRVAPGPVDYLLIRRSHVGDLSRAALDGALANRDEYGLLAERGDELFLFKRGHVSPATAAARAKLGVR